MARPSSSSSSSAAATTSAPPSSSSSASEPDEPLLVDALNRGVMRAIQTSGRSPPSSLAMTTTMIIPPEENDPPSSSYSSFSSSFRCEWIEYSSDLCCPVVESMRPYFPRLLVGREVGSDGRPLLYNACLALLLSKRRLDEYEDDDEYDGENDDEDDDDGKEGGGTKQQKRKRSTSTPLSTFLSVASFLLDELGVDPNQPTRTPGACQRPPLHLAARSCHPEAVRALLSRGADPGRTDGEGWTALMACCMPDAPKFEDGGPSDEERVETARILMNGVGGRGGDDSDGGNGKGNVDARNYCAYTALHYACEGLNHRLVRCLLEEGGADATMRTVWGQSCLGIVVSRRIKCPADASTCETIVADHLDRTGRSESIRPLWEEERKAMEIMDLANDVLVPASRRPMPDDGTGAGLEAQDRRIVAALAMHLGLDPDFICRDENFRLHHRPREEGGGEEEEDANPYEDVHRRIMALMPRAYLRVYRSSPTGEERMVITCANYGIRETAQIIATSAAGGGGGGGGGGRRIDTSAVMRESFRVHRERGHVARQLELLNDLIVGPLQRTFGFGIPGNAVLREIAARAPRIVEMGAGTGYWSYVLSGMGADVVAYDARPTALPAGMEGSDSGDHRPRGGGEKSANEYFSSRSYFPVREGDASTVFGGDVDPEISNRALLMVWPNNPDEVDNKHVAAQGGPKLPDIWDLECLEGYHASGGNVVIYAGEREAKIELMEGAGGADCGFCSSRKFQNYLLEHYDLVAEFECPRWWMKEDDVTMWERK